MKNKIKTIIEPLRPYIYDVNVSGEIKNLTAPPYDVISKELQDELYRRSEYNIIRLEYGKELLNDDNKENKYTRAAHLFGEWIDKGILKRAEKSTIYVYSQIFDVDGIEYERTGFMSLFKLPESKENNSIYGHEATLSKPKEDRFRLMENANANFSPVFSIFEDDNQKVLNILKTVLSEKEVKKIFDFIDDSGIRNMLYAIEDEKIIYDIQNVMSDKSVYIADGHHRFETCINYRDYVKKNGLDKKGINADYCLMFFAPSVQKGLVILPTHRGIKGKNINIENFIKILNKFFILKETNVDDLINENKKTGEKNVSFGFAHKSGRNFILSFKNETADSKAINPLDNLDVSILQEYILKKALEITQEEIDNQKYLVYEKDAKKALEKVKKGELEAVFFMNPTKIEDVIKIASVNLRMPQKSTYFYPKLISGLLINPLIKQS
ncbi:MAG: DUF1015 domain-containing protein [Candidatus Acidulodesulfobacterium acidiphilum]|uniref:DUF1015 domain-containing protein n=1 Tax=Candidatus Acidulodesulfobacterium acidiphilum TaxID=2597224 RepID=A0A520X7I7_9DELT|nr:MAG: DUF1015 domain-containing protein [Candidatus Acidulodesulfobacterium acidiphilum]